MNNSNSHHCDAHSAAARLVIMFVGFIGVWQVLTCTVYVFTTRPVDPLILTTLFASVGSTITALVALLGRVGAATERPAEANIPKGTPDDPVTTEATVVNDRDNPLPVAETYVPKSNTENLR